MKTTRYRNVFQILAAALGLCIPAAPLAAFPIEWLRLESENLRLTIEVLDDDLFHFEYTPTSDNRADAIPCSPMVYKRDYTGPSKLIAPDMNQLITPELQVDIDPTTLALSVTEMRRGKPRALGDLICTGLTADNSTLTIIAPGITHAYGLGEQFFEPPHTSANWIGRKRTPGCEFGNRHNGFLGGAVGNNMFPILYALGAGDECFAIFLDDTHAQTWDFTNRPWTITARAGALRGYILSGPNLRDLRRDYMELVGRPPVPPKKAFGFWVSEYGFDNWAELDAKLKTLRESDFPIDGFVLDLQWFGDVEPGGEQSQMGRVAWDRKRFPRPRAKIAQLAEKHGVGLVLIEESYITRGLAEHRRLAKEGLRFTDHYAGCTVCAPTRCVLMTGLHTGHSYVRGNREVKPEGQAAIPGDTVTVAKLLRQAGYATGAFGKWGLGAPGSEGDPTNQGFDTFFGYNCQREAHSYYPTHLWSNTTKVPLDGKTYSHDLIMVEALKFIRSHQQGPFFCYLPVTIPHAAMHVPEEYAAPFRRQFPQYEDKIGKYRGPDVKNPAAAFAGMMTKLDEGVGQIMNLLKELDIDQHTLVMLTSDNGPHREGGHVPDFFNSNGGLRGHKRDLYDGGIRVPLIARWPGVVPAGREFRPTGTCCRPGANWLEQRLPTVWMASR